MKIRLLFISCFLLLSSLVYGQNCISSVSITSSNPAICSGESVTLTATPSGGTAPYNYAWSTGETTKSINVNKAGTYTVTVSDKTNGCQPVKGTFTIGAATAPNAPTVAPGSACPNGTATLTATAPGGIYNWYSSATGGAPLYTGNPFTTPALASSTTFYVETIVNGCVSQRTSVLVTVTSAPTASGTSVCSGSSATLTAHGGNSYRWYDAQTGGTLLKSDSVYTTPALNATTTYYVEATNNGCVTNRRPVTVTVNNPPATPVTKDQVICSGSSITLAVSVPSGVLVNWYNVPTGGTALITSTQYTTPPLTATTTYYVETSSNGCTSGRIPIKVTVDSPPALPTIKADTVCYGNPATLKAIAPGGTYNWYDAASGGTLLFTGDTFTTPTLTTSTDYYVSVSDGNCVSGRTKVTALVNPLPPQPQANDRIVCYGSSATLTAKASSGTFQWYDTATGGNLLFTGDTYNTPALTANATYYVQTLLNGCISPRTIVNVKVLTAIPAPAANGQTICSGNSATLTATGGNNYEWYDAATGGNLLSSSQVYVTPALTATTTYYVQSAFQSCTSSRTAVTVTVNAPPSAPTVSGGGTVCPGSTATLTASATSGTFQWFDSATGTTQIHAGPTFTTSGLSKDTTFYVQTTSGTCISPRTAVSITVSAVTNPGFTYSSGTYCLSSPNPTPVIEDAAGGVFSSSSNGLVFVSNTTGEINIAASSPGAYLVSFKSNGSCGFVTRKRITIVTVAKAQFSYPSPICQNQPNVLPTFPSGAGAGVFTASNSGLVFKDKTTGEIDLSKSAAGTYTVTNTVSPVSCTADIYNTSITITPGTGVYAGPDQSVLTGTVVQLAGSFKNAAGVTWSGGTGSFSNTTDPHATYTPGPGETTATLKLTTNGGNCVDKSSTVTIHIGPLPASPTAANASVCMGSSTTLSATAPGGNYKWYDAATGGTLVGSGALFATPALTTTTNYYVQTTLNGLTSNRTQVTVTVDSIPAAPVVKPDTICVGTTATLLATNANPAATFQWFDAATGGNEIANTASYTTPVLTGSATYYVQTSINNCVSPRGAVSVVVNAQPTVTSASAQNICSGKPLGYTITSNVASAKYTWSRAAVTGISNPAVTNQTGAGINETLVNTSAASVVVTYNISAASGNCVGNPFTLSVTVAPTTNVMSAAADTICNAVPNNYVIVFNTDHPKFTWSRDAVAGISNRPISGQAADTIREALFNTTTAPIKVPYTIHIASPGCDSSTFVLTTLVNPTPNITSQPRVTVCSGQPVNYTITSDIPSSFIWSRDTIAGVSNPAVSGQTSTTINEVLHNTTSASQVVIYKITTTATNCQDTTFQLKVTVTPQPKLPKINSNSPVCIDGTIQLNTPNLSGATYTWTGPNGFTLSGTNNSPQITNATKANAGVYTLSIAYGGGCPSDVATDTVAVDDPPTAYAGPAREVCFNTDTIHLAGRITGGTNTGIWTSGGTGTFSPEVNDLNAIYSFTAADRAAGTVTLTLSSTSKDGCAISTSDLKVTFDPLPIVDAGKSVNVCSQDASVPLTGSVQNASGGTWTTSGSGHFSPDANTLTAQYIPSSSDVSSGMVSLTLASTPGNCASVSKTIYVRFIPPPTITVRPEQYVVQGKKLQLITTVSSDSVTYSWTPTTGLDNPTAKNPIVTGGSSDITYTLTVTDPRGCTAQASVLVKELNSIVIYNTFTPNGDGINDYWDIPALVDYPNVIVDVYDRDGRNVFHSVGYPKPWDGLYGGKVLPAATYYYVIKTGIDNEIFSGWVALLK